MQSGTNQVNLDQVKSALRDIRQKLVSMSGSIPAPYTKADLETRIQAVDDMLDRCKICDGFWPPSSKQAPDQ